MRVPKRTCGRGLFNVAQQSHAPKYPMIRAECSSQINGRYIGEVSSLWFLVNWTLVGPLISAGCCVDGVHVNDGQWFE